VPRGSLRSCIAVSVIALGALGGADAYATDARVVVIAEGESSRGVPKFRLKADSRLIGEAQLGRSLGGEIAGQQPANTMRYSGRFEFFVQNIEKVTFLEIEIPNDKKDQEETPADVTLAITGFSVNGVRFDPASLAFVDGTASPKLQGRLRLARPATGWTEEERRLAAAEEQR